MLSHGGIIDTLLRFDEYTEQHKCIFYLLYLGIN